jgi:hypothetical protein
MVQLYLHFHIRLQWNNHVVVMVPDYRSRGPGSIPDANQIFRVIVRLERGPLSLVSTIEELLDRKRSSSGLEKRDYGRGRSAALTMPHSSTGKSRH